MEKILTIIALANLAHLATYAVPFRIFLKWLGLAEEIPLKREFSQKWFSFCVSLLRELFSCEMCLSFWFAIAWTGDILQASLACLAAHLLTYLYDKTLPKF